MVEVNLWSGLRRLTDGQTKIEIEASSVGQLIDGLSQKYPDLKEFFEEQVSVSINGRIIAGSWAEPIPDGAEVWLLQRLRGG